MLDKGDAVCEIEKEAWDSAAAHLESAEGDVKIAEKKASKSAAERDAALHKLNVVLKMENMIQGTSSFDISQISVGREHYFTLTEQLSGDQGAGNSNLLNRIIRLLTQILGTVGVALLVISGITMIVSSGDENLLTKGKTMFLYTVIGIIIGFLSYALVHLIISVAFRVFVTLPPAPAIHTSNSSSSPYSPLSSTI